jgi:hypothetical protein
VVLAVEAALRWGWDAPALLRLLAAAGAGLVALIGAAFRLRRRIAPDMEQLRLAMANEDEGTRGTGH